MVSLITYAFQVALVPIAARASLVPALAAVCLAQTALEVACLAHPAHLLLGPVRLLLGQATQVLEGEVAHDTNWLASSTFLMQTQPIIVAFLPLRRSMSCISARASP